MNKKQLVLLVLVVSVGLAIHAQQGGYKGPGTSLITVQEAKALKQHYTAASVILQGKIERLILDMGSTKQYSFSDDTGELVLIISDSTWGDLSVDENDTVEIRGLITQVDGVRGTYTVVVQSIKKL